MPASAFDPIKLVPKSVGHVRAMLDAMSPQDRANVSPDWVARAFSPDGPDPWTLGYTLVRERDGVAVGQCGFKGPPSQGVVEIAYGVRRNYEGRGYATQAARALVALAFACDDVTLVVAHTFERTNASSSVLSKVDFVCVGQVIDPEDGTVWRWEKKRDRA